MVSAANNSKSFGDYANSINYNDAKKHIKNENGITQEVFVRYIRTEFGDVAAKDAGNLFKAIDKNNSGGLREREFNRFAASAYEGTPSTRSASIGDGASEARRSSENRNASEGGRSSANRNASEGGGASENRNASESKRSSENRNASEGGRSSEIRNASEGIKSADIKNASEGSRSADIRNASEGGSTSNAGAVNSNVSSNGVNASFGGYKKLTRVDGGTDRFNNVKSDYLVIVESHGRNASSKVSANQLPKVAGATLVDFGGSHDKYIALYKITDSTVSITGDGGSGQALFLNTDKKVSLNAKAVDPSLGGEKLKGPSQSNQLVIYADDEGGKGNKTNGVADRDQFFRSNSKSSYGGGDDLIYIIGHQVSPGNNKGPTLNGASGVLTFS